MKSSDIRKSFLAYFRARDHREVPSAPLVPHGDSSLLFTNAGMVQFKDLFTGVAVPEFRRAVSVQKCLRVSGKHNDLENVGPSPRHHTFFEMLGNFSFGDYFKPEAIEWAWDLVTREWGVPRAHLYVSVFEEDEEAEDLWKKIAGLPSSRIKRSGVKDNFWAMGDTGPCGPCSEIYLDREPTAPEVSWEEGTGSGRYLELWNLVFMQYERRASGELVPLPRPSIDTGAGLERVTAALSGLSSNYDTDLFRPILDGTAALSGKAYGEDPRADVSLRVIADHLRALAFLLADGVVPANEGRGYVLRRLLRRAVRHGMKLGFREPFLARLLPLVEEAVGEAYPELRAVREASQATLTGEEERFFSTLAAASSRVQQAIEEAKLRGARELSGTVAFRLYDTYGVPIQVLREIVEEEQLHLDEPGFEAALREQRERSRAAATIGERWVELVRPLLLELEVPPSRFVGYIDSLETMAAVLVRPSASMVALFRWAEDGQLRKVAAGETLRAGEEGVLLVGETPFYPEGGGQVADTGWLRWSGGLALVTDVQKDRSWILHRICVQEGRLSLEDVVELAVDVDRRLACERHHTATHLLHAALRQLLGSGVRQAGSLVHPEILRFDFTLPRPTQPGELVALERQVNAWIRQALPTQIEADCPLEEALARGAVALFGEKYGEKVRTVAVPGVSLELCGGCHVRNTGEIGLFWILSERGTAAGVRRIEAVAGEPAWRHARERNDQLAQLEEQLGVARGEALRELSRREAEMARLRRELERARRDLLRQPVGGSSGVSRVGEIEVYVRELPEVGVAELRRLAAEALEERSGPAVVVVGSSLNGKVAVIAAVDRMTSERVSAADLVRRIGEAIGGSGGGKADFAQAGGRAPEKLAPALRRVPEWVEELVAASAALGPGSSPS